MREVRSAPTSWPTPEAWQRLWQQLTDELARLEVDRHGEVHHPEEDLPGRLHLVAGTHLRDGARYHYEDDHSRGDLTIAGDDRVVLFALTPLYGGGDRALEVRLDGLERFTGADVLFAAPHLSVDVSVRNDPAEFVSARGRVPWLEGTQTHVVEPGSEGVDVLRVETSLESRGAWSPVVGSVLALLGSLLRSGLDDLVKEVAAGLATTGDEPLTVRPDQRAATPAIELPPLDPEAMADAVDVGFALLETRLTAVLAALDEKPWWRSRQGVARSALRRQPSPVWPSDTAALGPFDTWITLERRLVGVLVATPQEHRDLELRTQLGEARETADGRVRSARLATGAGSHPMTIDTAPLASPWTALKQLRRMSA
ncbi:hypothetical protein GCM10027425_04880 [Alteromonas gracilis]